jgi:hypothetical protein
MSADPLSRRQSMILKSSAEWVEQSQPHRVSLEALAMGFARVLPILPIGSAESVHPIR